MIKFRKTNKKHVARIYLAQLLVFILSMFFVGMGVYAQSPENSSETYKITLPQKVEGVKKLEYVIDDKNMGSTAGTESVDVASGSVINFLIQIKSEGYNKLCAKDVKISTESGKALGLMRYMCNKNGDLTKVPLSENDILDPNQTYVTSDYKAKSKETFSLGNLEKDSFSANIRIDSAKYSANESLNVSYSLGKNSEKQTPIYNKDTNSLEIQKITFGTPITLTINPKEDFSQSEPKIFVGENEVVPFSDGSITLPAIKSDVNIEVKNINKNKYTLFFENYEDISFEYKKQGDGSDFTPATPDALEVISGESYEFKCTPKNEDTLTNKEVTSNGVALKKENNVYTLANIKENIQVSVTALEDSYYGIALPDENSGAVITDESGSAMSSAKAKFGDDFKFKISAREGYENSIDDATVYAAPTSEIESGNYDVSKNSEEAKKYLITPSNTGVYVISEVKQPISLIVKNLVKNSYKVRFPEKLEGASYKVESSEGVTQISEHAFSVVRDSKLIVTLTAEEGKSVDNATIGCNNSKINVSKDGNKYTIENITDDSDIIIGDIEDKICNVTFDSNGITCADETGSIFSKNTVPVNYKGSAKFSVRLADGYESESGITLNATPGNANLTKLSEENYYEISNITDDVKISVTGVKKTELQLRLTSIDSSAIFRTTDGKKILPDVNAVEYGSGFEFEVISQSNENQTYSINSSDSNLAVEAIDSYNNKFVVRNITSDVTLSAVTVFDSETDAQNGASSPKKLGATNSLQTRGLTSMANTGTEDEDNGETRGTPTRNAEETVELNTSLTNMSDWFYQHAYWGSQFRQIYYYYDSNLTRSDNFARTLYDWKPYSFDIAKGDENSFVATDPAQPSKGSDLYKVKYTKQANGSWQGEYKIRFRTQANEAPNGINQFMLCRRSHSAFNVAYDTQIRKNYTLTDSNGIYQLNSSSNASTSATVTSTVTGFETTDFKVNTSGGVVNEGKEIALKIQVNISNITDISSITNDMRVQIYDQLDVHVQRKYIDSDTINTCLAQGDRNVFAFYYKKFNSQNPNRNIDYQFYYNADPYNPNASYTNINEGRNYGGYSSRLVQGYNIQYRRRSDNGYWEGTCGVRFKCKANFETDKIDNIKFFAGTKDNGRTAWPHTDDRTLEYLKNCGPLESLGDNRVRFEILECESIHSSQDPGAEEYLLQIKVTIAMNADMWDIKYGNNHLEGSQVTLFQYFDIQAHHTRGWNRYFNLNTLEKLIQFRSEDGSFTASKVEFISNNKAREATPGTDGIGTMDLSSSPPLNKVQLVQNAIEKPHGDFSMKFKVTGKVNNQVKSANINPIFSYVSDDGTIKSGPLEAGKNYTIITAKGTENQYLWSNFFRTTDIYNKVNISITECQAGATSYGSEGGVDVFYREFTLSGTCTLEDYSCGAKNNNSSDLGYLFESHQDTASGQYVGSYVSYNKTQWVISDINFENAFNATFFKNSTGNEEFTEPITINPTSDNPSETSANFTLKVKDYYKFADEVKTSPLRCLKVDGGADIGNICTIEATDVNIEDGYITYKISHTQKSPITIGINPHMVDSIKYTGTFGGKYSSYKNADGGTIDHHSFKHGDDIFRFVINPSEEAQGDPINFNVTVGNSITNYTPGNDFSTPDGKFSMTSKVTSEGIEVELAGIETDFTIIVDYDRKNIPVTFNTDGSFSYLVSAPTSIASLEEISVSTNKTVKYGQNISFIITASDNIDTSNITVTANGIPLYMVDNKYTIKYITEEQTIEVTNISTISNNVTFTRYDDVTFKDLESKAYAEKVPVEYDNDIQFRVSLSEGYSLSEKDMKVRAEFASGQNYQFGSGNQAIALYDSKTNLYTLKNIKENVRIYIENIEPNTYKISFDNSGNNATGIKYYDQYGTTEITGTEQNVPHGENFSFKVVAKEGYDLSNLKIYDREGTSETPKQILPAHDVYTLTNVTNDHTITAQDATLSKCKIEFRTLQGATCVDSSGNTISSAVSVDYGTNYKFKLSLDKAYSRSTPTVTLKGTAKPLTKGADGTYTISGIKEDKIIEVTNVKKNAYTATFKDAEGVIYKTAKNKPFTGTQPVEYDGTLYFKISLMDAYDKSTPWVLMNDDKTLVENSGMYSISNIHDDVVITVKNVVKNPEEVSISHILQIPPEVTSESDVDSVVKATKTYMNLSDEEKEQVTNVDDLKRAQERASELNHSHNGVEVSGIDWNIKLVVTPLNDDKEKMKSFEEKLERRSLLSLYEIHLIDLITGKDYEVPYGQDVSVILPSPDLTGCTNEVVAHEKSSGSMEYLDLNIVDGRAEFQTSSFSMFGIAAKKIENYVENPSDMKISVNSLVDNEDELKSLLGEGLTSKLGKLIDDEQSDNTEGNTGNDNSQGDGSLDNSLDAGMKKLLGGIDLEDTYNWILDNELYAVIVILLLGSLLVWWLLALARKKKKEEEEEKTTSKK